MTSGKFKTISIGSITIDRAIRQRRTVDGIDELADSINRIGLINPPVIRKDGNLVAGERRVTACRQLGWTSIPVQFIEDLPELEAKIIELEENLRRVDLTWQDQCRAIQQYHNARMEQDNEWTIRSTSKSLGIDERDVSRKLQVAPELNRDNIAKADKFSTAHGIIHREHQRRRDAIISTVSLDDEPPQAAEVPPLLNEDFLEWAPKYDGPPFNFIHCDFPYGINADKHDQGSAKGFGGYEDTPELYRELLSCLLNNRNRLASESCHLMTWLSFDFWSETVKALKEDGWRVHERPLIWYRSDNSGIIPDPRRQPRRVYETALMASWGDRFIAQSVADLFPSPNVKSVHMSEKPRPVLQHFFRMFVDESSRVLDPTCGSANALKVAKAMGANFVLGIERDPEFYRLACETWSNDNV